MLAQGGPISEKCCVNGPMTREEMKNHGDKVFVHGAASTPTLLLYALAQHAQDNDLHEIQLMHIHTFGEGPLLRPLASPNACSFDSLSHRQ